MQTKTNIYTALGLFIVCFVLSSYLGVSTASATSVTITTNNNIALNASTTNDGVTIDEESINITTTCNKGYDLTIATSTSTNLYLNGDSTKTAAYTAVDGTSALNSSNNTNKWGYTTTSEATSSTVFSPLSTSASAIRTISQTTDLTSETIPIYYGIKTDNTVDPGTYSMGNNGVITYYLTMNPQCSITNITYDGNNADEGTMAAVHENVKDGDVINLVANNFSKQGYGFAGWSTDPDAGAKLLDSDNTNNPIVYGPQETVTLPEGFTDKDTDHDGIVKLYAVWLQSQGNLQNWMGCNSLDTTTYDQTTGALDITKNSVTALTDQRDNDTYAVARLADGQCWMIENLRLDNDAAHNTDGSLAQGYGTSAAYGNFAGLANPESTGFTDTYSPNNLYSNNGSNNTINIGASDFPEYRMPRFNNINTSNRASNPTSNNDTMYIYGNYYTWPAAIADLSYYDTNNESATSTSICPAGWHLPKGGGKAIVDGSHDNDFWNLTVDILNSGVYPTNYSSSTYPYYDGVTEANPLIYKLRAYPNNIIYSGYFDTSTATNLGTYGCYWSATIDGNNRSYSLTLEDNSYVYPGTRNNGKAYGRSIRCVASIPQIYTVTFDANTTDTVTGTMEDQTISIDETATLRTNTFQRPATTTVYRFAKWNTEPDGTGTDYADGASVTNLAAVGETITLYAQWSPVYSIQYDGNGAENTNGMGTIDISTGEKSVRQTNIGEGDLVMLLPSNFKRTGYGFAGWSTNPNATTTGNDIIYGPMETITAPPHPGNSENILTLYAVWVEPEKDGSNNPVYLQDFTASDCNALTGTTFNADTGVITPGSVIALTDKRDNEVYAIAKLADDSCWMIENLRLEHEATKGNNTNDGSVTNQSLSQGYGSAPGTYGSFVGLPEPESAYFANSTNPNSIYKSSANPPVDTYDPANNILEDIGTEDYPGRRVPRYNNSNTKSMVDGTTYIADGTTASDDNGYMGAKLYSYGNYYTWPAAAANTAYFEDATGASGSINANTSICPTNWSLPIAGDSRDGFVKLARQYGSTGGNQASGTRQFSDRLRAFPNNFIHSGYYEGSSVTRRGKGGYYWSRNSTGHGDAANFTISDDALLPSSYYQYTSNGIAVRCKILGS